MQEAGEREAAAPERGEGLSSRLEERGVLPPRLEERIVPSRLEERLNITVTGAEPSSPSREAAKGSMALPSLTPVTPSHPVTPPLFIYGSSHPPSLSPSRQFPANTFHKTRSMHNSPEIFHEMCTEAT